MAFRNVKNEAELREAVAEQLRDGSLSLSVPMFSGNSWPFDLLVRDGLASSYSVVIEISLRKPGGVL
jgi:hypothetical protein